MAYVEAPSRQRLLRPSTLTTCCLILAFAVLLASQLDHFMWDDDESVHVLAARAVGAGQRLYDTVWFGYTPGFLYLLASALRLPGSDLVVARALVGALSLLGLGATAMLARTLSDSPHREWAPLGAVILLATIPHVIVMSSAVLIEVPAMALATLGVLLSVRGLSPGRGLFSARGLVGVDPGHRGWLSPSRKSWCLGAICVSCALAMKPTVLAAAVVPPLCALWGERRWADRWRSVALVGLCGVLPLTLLVLLSNPAGFWRHVILTYVLGEQAVVVDLGRNVTKVLEYLFYDKYRLTHAMLVLWAGLGLVSLWRRGAVGRRLTSVMGAWLGVTVLLLVTHAPLYRHHLVQILFPLAALGGVGFAAGVAALDRSSSEHNRPDGRARRWVLAALLAMTALEVGACLRVDLISLREIESDHVDKGRDAVAFLREHTVPGDYIITDAHILAVRSDRDVPPELTETSRRRIRTGQLTSASLIDLAQRYRPAAIVFWEEKLEPTEKPDAEGDPDYLDPSFRAWVEETYVLGKRYSDRHRIYLRP